MNAQSQFVIALGTVSALFATATGQYGIAAGVGAVSLTCGFGMEYIERKQETADSNGGDSA